MDCRLQVCNQQQNGICKIVLKVTGVTIIAAASLAMRTEANTSEDFGVKDNSAAAASMKQHKKVKGLIACLGGGESATELVPRP